MLQNTAEDENKKNTNTIMGQGHTGRCLTVIYIKSTSYALPQLRKATRTFQRLGIKSKPTLHAQESLSILSIY